VTEIADDIVRIPVGRDAVFAARTAPVRALIFFTQSSLFSIENMIRHRVPILVLLLPVVNFHMIAGKEDLGDADH
jgi:hypothetical protein